MLSSLHDFIQLIERSGDLHRVETQVSTHLELAAITRRVCASTRGCHALLFLHPDEFRFPVATNLFGSRRRMRQALGLDSMNDLTDSFGAILETMPRVGVEKLGSQLAVHPDLACCASVVVAHGPCRDQTEPSADLLQLPFPQGWPDDGLAAGTGRYITMGQIVTANPDGSDLNYGIYRCQIHDAHTLAIRWRRGSGAERHHRQFVQRGERMPLAIVLGGPPAFTLAAAWPLPQGLNEVDFAGWLRGAGIPVVDCPHGPLRVPAEAELVIEGFAEPDLPLIEGPFGNHTGRYDPAGPTVRVTVTRITRRQEPVIPVTVVGPPPQEDCWMMLGWERLLAALLRHLVPGLHDICLPLPWVFRQSAVISLVEPTAGMVRDVVHALWQLPWFAKARLLVVVDAAIAPNDLRGAAWRVVNETYWLDDLIRDESGRRLAVDATKRTTEEGLEDEEIGRLIEQRWKEYGL